MLGIALICAAVVGTICRSLWILSSATFLPSGRFPPSADFFLSGQPQLSQHVSRLAKILDYWKTRNEVLFTVPDTTQCTGRNQSKFLKAHCLDRLHIAL